MYINTFAILISVFCLYLHTFHLSFANKKMCLKLGGKLPNGSCTHFGLTSLTPISKNLVRPSDAKFLLFGYIHSSLVYCKDVGVAKITLLHCSLDSVQRTTHS